MKKRVDVLIAVALVYWMLLPLIVWSIESKNEALIIGMGLWLAVTVVILFDSSIKRKKG